MTAIETYIVDSFKRLDLINIVCGKQAGTIRY